MTQPAPPSTSSSFLYGFTYDVFLNFRGEDTRNGFTGNLYNALHQRGIHTFIDDEDLKRGEEITPSLLKAIEESRIAITIFSENYASSTFCLEELVKILECVNGKGRLVLPVFYGVDPSEVRHQRKSYGKALVKHQNKHKVEEWRLALHKAANFSGWHFKQGSEYEYAFIRKIIEEVSDRLKRAPLHIANYPVGLEPRIQEVNKLLGVGLDDDKVKMVGIYGIGGIGKTTIACAVYNSIADQFEALCFLADIREKSNKNGLASLQETLLLDLVGEDIKLGDVNRGIPIIKRRLNQKKILLILDDVDKLQQLQAIAGGSDWFGSGSRVIITTRDKHLLIAHGVKKLYEAKALNNKDALELFSWNAFNAKEVDPSYLDISNRAISYAKGLPLALQIIGSNLFGKSLIEWKSALDYYEGRPNRSVQEILRVSYDGLEDQEKEIFLDIACFFGGERLDYVTNMLLHSLGCQPEYGIGVLIQKSLLTVKYGPVSMHNLIEEMGKEIVRQESPEPGYRSRLWFYEDIIHVLEEDTGSEKIEVIMLDLPEDEEVCWTGEEFKKMKNLKILKIINASFSTCPKYLPNTLRVLDWRRYPWQSLPSDFHPRKLSILNLPNSCIILNKPLKNFKSLTQMNFEGSEALIQLPDLSGVPNLTELCLDDCINLIEVHDSIGFLQNLRTLSAEWCTKLSKFPHGINLTSLEKLSLWGCSSLKNFPEILGKMENLTNVNLGSSAIEELPYSIHNLTGLERLDLIRCRSLTQLPSSIFMLPKLESLEAESCRGCQIVINFESQENMNFLFSSRVKDLHFRACNLSDEYLHVYFTCFPSIEMLHLGANDFTTLPTCIKECPFLTILYLDDCKQLQHIMALPPHIKFFSARNCISLNSESTRILLSQEIHEAGDTHFVFPGSKIPDWFDHCNKGASVSFSFRNKFPAIALCFVFGCLDKKPRKFRFKFHVFINGNPSFSSNEGNSFTILTDHIFLFDLKQKVELPPKQIDQVVLENERNHVEVHCLDSPYALESSIDKAIVKWSGVYVYKEGNHMEDVQFTSTNPQNTTYDSDLVNRYPWMKKCALTDDMATNSSTMVLRRTLGTTSDKDVQKQQQQSTSMDQQILKPCATAERATETSLIVCNSSAEDETTKNPSEML